MARRSGSPVTLLTLMGALVATLSIATSGCSSDDKVAPATTPAVPTIARPGAATSSPSDSTPTTGAGVSTVAPATLIVATLGGKQVLTDVGGFTLYTFDRDTPGDGKSACNGVCTSVWRPLLIDGQPPVQEGLTGVASAITRRDGATQMTYNGRPLYRFISDEQPGDIVGDGNGGIWHAATP